MSTYFWNLKKIIAWSILVILILAITIGAYVVFRFAVKKFNTKMLPLDIELNIKDIHSKSDIALIKNQFDLFKEQIKEEKFNLSSVCLALKKVSFLISDIGFKQAMSKNATLYVFGKNPKFAVNNKFILAEDKRFYDKRFFELYDLSLLKKINLPEQYCERELSEKFYDFLNKIPKDIWDNYEISYQKPTFIKLRSLHDSFEVNVDEYTVFDLEKINKVGDVFSDIRSKKLMPHYRALRNLNILSFDLRFKNRILVRQ